MHNHQRRWNVICIGRPPHVIGCKHSGNVIQQLQHHDVCCGIAIQWDGTLEKLHPLESRQSAAGTAVGACTLKVEGKEKLAGEGLGENIGIVDVLAIGIGVIKWQWDAGVGDAGGQQHVLQAVECCEDGGAATGSIDECACF